jgi:hypothetical protein
MSTLNFGITKENRRGWFLVALLAVLLLAGAAAWYIWAGAAPGAAVNDQPAKSPAALWESQAIDNYRYTLQVGCFCLVDVTRPVIVEVKDGQVASITYADDGTAADPGLGCLSAMTRLTSCWLLSMRPRPRERLAWM